ncbi:nitrilase-related carbon-nitrogen hydrolase [Rhodanobacter sp. L36]|uniref:nitrilase-related carbon-nitrogen hydrolase n=1 Tax=Rhodanobacter sp. L36 TaxID=1747221 RepID=UPI00131BD20C|nr:nitrilase-related carbon-nitrogen hydrolase [Rhodanobacter sp. L36]
MASRLDNRFAKLTWLAATLLTAAMWWLGSGLQPLWWLTWFAPLPVLWLAPRVRTPWALLAAFTAYAIGSLNEWSYLHEAIGLPMVAIMFFIAMPGVMLALCVWLFRRLLLRGYVMVAALSVSSAWVSAEYVYSLLSPHSTFGNIAYTQMDALAIIQVAAMTGLWGVGFILLLLPAAIAACIASRTTGKLRSSAPVLLAAAIVAALAIYGSWRLRTPAASTMRIGLVSLQKPAGVSLSEPAGQALEVRYLAVANRLGDQGAKLVLMPETTFKLASANIPAFAQLAHAREITMATGVDSEMNPSSARNMLMVFRPRTPTLFTYSKHHLLIGLEQYKPGTDYTMLDATPRIGLAICKDMDFHDIGWAYAARDTQLLLVPASDFTVDGWLHSRMAIMRGVENGFAIARAAHAGRLTLSDDRGRVLAEASSEHQDAEVVGDLSLRETHTLYSRFDDWFAWLNLFALVSWLAIAFLPRAQIDSRK